MPEFTPSTLASWSAGIHPEHPMILQQVAADFSAMLAAEHVKYVQRTQRENWRWLPERSCDTLCQEGRNVKAFFIPPPGLKTWLEVLVSEDL